MTRNSRRGPPPTGFDGSLRPYQERGLAWLSFLAAKDTGLRNLPAESFAINATAAPGSASPTADPGLIRSPPPFTDSEPCLSPPDLQRPKKSWRSNALPGPPEPTHWPPLRAATERLGLGLIVPART